MKEKLLTVTVPCYNSSEYMCKCIKSLLAGGEDMEIIIVNDGSTDETLSIAREYETAYPSIIRVVDKPNGGHGSGVNAGLARATGRYFKVVDSDDGWTRILSVPFSARFGRTSTRAARQICTSRILSTKSSVKTSGSAAVSAATFRRAAVCSAGTRWVHSAVPPC